MDNQQSNNPLTPPPGNGSVHVGSDIPGGGNPIWQAFKSSKLLKIGLPLLLVALLPVVVLLAREQQTNQSRASAATVISISPASSQAVPTQVKTGESITLVLEVDPGTNLLSSLQLDISYDPSILQLESSADFAVNETAFPTILGEPAFSSGKINAMLSVGPDPTKAVQNKVKVATIVLKAIKEGETTLVAFGPKTSALSIGAEDRFSENVLSSANGTYIRVSQDGIGSSPATAVGTVNTGGKKAAKTNPNRGGVRGEYLDSKENPLILANMQAVLSEQGKNAGTVNKNAPVFNFENVKPGKYRLQVVPITGYNSVISVCEKRCKEAKPQYKREYSVNFEVVAKKTIHVGIKYVPNGTLQATPIGSTGTPAVAEVTVQTVCNGTTADVNKDGRVDNADQTIATNCLNKNTTETPSCAASDTNKDTVVDIVDLNCVLRGGQ